jgi:RNA polymerase sigma factor (sigma-70 family)
MEHREELSSDETVVEALLRRVRCAITKLRRQWGWVVNSDVWADIEQEARLTLWKALPRLKSLPTEEQETYAASCVRRAAIRALRRELKHKRHALFLEDLAEHDSCAGELRRAEEHSTPEPSSPQDLLAHLDDPLLADAFRALSENDQMVVFSVVMGLSDSEIADALQITVDATTKRRQRAVKKMRTFIAKLDGGGVNIFVNSLAFILAEKIPERCPVLKGRMPYVE